MNDLNLRVSGGIGEKVKKPVAPITMPEWNTDKPDIANKFIMEFLNSKSADDQLKLLKQYLNKNKDVYDEEIIKFLVLLFWHADAKHPVKGFLKKHITESRTLRDPFVKRLIKVITDEIKESADLPYENYIGVVTRLDTCIDKFPPGAAAVSDLEIAVATYLLHCLESCVATLDKEDDNVHLGKTKVEPLSPTEINKICDLTHLALRLLLYMIQKVTEPNRGALNAMFGRIRSVTAGLTGGLKVPMDTKSVSGIITLNLYLFENGPDSWIELLEKTWLGDTVELCMCSAIATAVPRAALLAAPGRPALLRLADRVLAIGDRYSSEPSHTLAVARTLLAISKALGGAQPTLARPLGARLAGYCWAHLEHHMDSVRHLAAQLLSHVVGAAVSMDKEGDPSALDEIFSALDELGWSRRTWTALALLGCRLGARVLARRPGLLARAAAALRDQPQQASATVFLETLLKRYMQESSPETVHREYVQVILEAAKQETEPSALGILENLLAKAVQWDSQILEYIIPDRSQLQWYRGADLKCALLVLGVARRAGAAPDGAAYAQLRHAAYDADDEVRVLALALAAACPRAAQRLEADELRFVLRWLRYNLNAQAPAFRQLLLANMKKILKRLEDSLKAHLRTDRSMDSSQTIAYRDFVMNFQQLCFDSLVPGANYGRRCCALQLLAWQRGLLELLGVCPWTEERAEVLYNVLEDTYENNKALALEVLKDCPPKYISKIEGPPEPYLALLLSAASSVKPTECVSASYKLLLLCRRTGAVPLSADTEGYPERTWFCVLRRLLRALRAQAARAQDLLLAARDAPMFGLLHCLNRTVGCIDARAIAGHDAWAQLVRDIIAACDDVNARVESVVCSACPEGLLPTDPDDGGDACLADGRPVTAQMVLLCAWRSVKETSLLLGALVSRLALEGEEQPWTLSAAQVEEVGDTLLRQLARLRHRGAFEQAYVGLTALLARLWRCSARLHRLPLQWFAAVERDLLLPAPEDGTEFCATRRGAGLPFMVQALVTTELAASSTEPRGRLLARGAALCLRGARAGGPAAARAHLVLRALALHAAPSAPALAQALVAAIRGFDADDWMERNSSTLLFAALTVRVFGVARARDPRRASARNKMTGRIFFLNYPELYDFLLEQLQAARVTALRPSLFPTLLLLARLYPSALEGTVSNLKLERFLPLLQALAGAPDAATRRLAARAARALVAPPRYVPHLQSLFEKLSDPEINRNLCHGILCQLSELLDGPRGAAGAAAWLPAALRAARWLAAPRARPCYLVADEFLNVLQLLLLRFPQPGLLDAELTAIATHLDHALFTRSAAPVTSGREVYLANAAYMYLIILTRVKKEDIARVTLRCLSHPDYEVQLSALNYLLMLHGHCDEPCGFLQHLSQISNADVLRGIQNHPAYIHSLCDASKSGYAECTQKALKVITLSPGCPETQRCLVRLKLDTNQALSIDRVVAELLDSALNGPESLSHIYLESVIELVSQDDYRIEKMLPVLRALHEQCSAAADECSRAAVVTFLEKNYARLLEESPGEEHERCERSATTLALAAILLEDDAPELRARTAAAVAAAHDTKTEMARGVLAARAAERLRRWAGGAGALPAVLAVLDFRAALASPHRLDDEFRVFDQNETHNVYLEEFTWTRECAKIIKDNYNLRYGSCQHDSSTPTIDEYVASLAKDNKKIIEQLCIDDAFLCLTTRTKSHHPKMDLFWKILHQ